MLHTTLQKNLILLAKTFDLPLYVVGGTVRNYLINGLVSLDVDLAGAIPSQQFMDKLEKCGFKQTAVYKRTGTVMFTDGVHRYEYTAFRRETYVKGMHQPEHVEFTDSIYEDALRRDFKCNAVYYDIKNRKFVDILGGINDIKNKVLDTVQQPDKVFCADGLRLLRLARFAGELDFMPTEAVLSSARKFADNILDISAERVFSELKTILIADTKYPFSNNNGHYVALKILDKTRVLDRIMPELAQGRGMGQRADFHKYDVLEHSLRTVLYAPTQIRLSALLHDIGKPYCFLKNGKYHNHNLKGVVIAERVLERLKADNKTISEVKFLVKDHMLDLDLAMRENKVKLYIVKNYAMLYQLFALKQADFSAGKDSQEKAPTIIKWQNILDKMIACGTPFKYKDLSISSADLSAIGFKGQQIGKQLEELFDFCVLNPDQNVKEILINMSKKTFDKIK